jgi:pyruvate/2-oxoglutarate dehydrogenase complex dihydrolipoamide acyltransferase (E2) component
MAKEQKGYTVAPFPKNRRSAIDAGRLGRDRHTVHGLAELDVTEARRFMGKYEAQNGERLSFTAFVVACLARAAGEHKGVCAHVNWRNQLVTFDEIHVNVMIEVESQGRKVPMPYIIQGANHKTFYDIHREIRAVQARPTGSLGSNYLRWFLRLPWPIRRTLYWIITRNPQRMGAYRAEVLVTALGMFSQGSFWGIPLSSWPLTVTLGGIAQKPGVVDGEIKIREYLCVTLSFDHNVVDGAPAARFAQGFRELVESGYGLE